MTQVPPIDPNPLQYVTIDDFRAGMVSSTLPSTDVNFKASSLNLPPGAADPQQTIGCYALPTGQLAPLPAIAQTQSFTMDTSGATGLDTTFPIRTIGLATAGPGTVSTAGAPFTDSSAVYNDELFLFVSGRQSGGNFQRFNLFLRKLYFGTVPADYRATQTGVCYTAADANGTQWRGITHAFTRARAANYYQPGYPMMVYEWSESPSIVSGVSTVFAGGFPAPAAPAVDGVWNTAAFTSPVQMVAHLGRIIFLSETGWAHGAGNGVITTNEDIFYTDPPNSITPNTGSPTTILDPQYPGGYGAWGSITYGELILIKRYGGAILVEGDIYSPQITRLTGVRSTGDMCNPGSWSPKGLVYCVEDDGVWLWEGGNNSRKISRIQDDFFVLKDGQATSGVKVKHTSWGQFVVFPNGYIWDSVTEGWWSLPTTGIGALESLGVPESGKGNPSHLFFATPKALDDGAGNFKIKVYVYDSTNLGGSYTWASQPIVPTDTRVDISEVILNFTGGSGNSNTITVKTGSNLGTTFGTVTLTPDPVTPVRVRIPGGAKNQDSIRIIVSVVANTPPAPVLNSIQVGWRPSTKLPQGQSIT